MVATRSTKGLRASVTIGVLGWLVLAGFGLPVGAAATAAAVQLGPNQALGIAPGSTTVRNSTNWGGYAISTANGAVSDVKGSWVVPTFQGSCSGLYNFSAAAFWVGIDGYSSNTVEQIGTIIECLSLFNVSSVVYYAFYEFYPAGTVTIPLTVSPGDHVSAQVSYTSSTGIYVVSLADTTTGNTYSASSSSSVSGNRSSAEWIAEAPYSSIRGILPLVDFGTVHFTACSATISGHTHAISGFSNVRITMVTTSGSGPKATPGALAHHGKRFAVTWNAYGP